VAGSQDKTIFLTRPETHPPLQISDLRKNLMKFNTNLTAMEPERTIWALFQK